MKQMTWAIVMVGLLWAGSTLPAQAASGRGGGFQGGGGMVRSSGGGWHGGTRWHGGGTGWHGGFHGHGTRVFIGGVGWWGWPGWWGPGWWGAPYPYYYGYGYGVPPVAAQSAPTTYIEPAPPAQTYWYYCQNAGTYYPYVKECPGGWMQVVPPTPPGQ